MADVYKVKIMKSGYPITDTDVSHIAFDSDINTFKIRLKETVSLTVENDSYSVAHGLDYVPAILAWFEVDGDGRWYSQSTKEDISGHNVSLYAAANETHLVIWWYFDSAPSSLKVHYQLIVDPI
jgi:flagellar basal body rod protein FlgG